MGGGDLMDVGLEPSASVVVARRASRVREDLVAKFVDAGLVIVTLATALVLHYEGDVPARYRTNALEIAPLVIGLVLVASQLSGLYEQVWRHASIVEARRLVTACAMAFGAVLLLDVFVRVLPLATVVMAGVLYTGVSGLIRFQTRLLATRRSTSRRPGVTRVLLVGAGDAGAALLRDMDRSSSDLVPVAIVDDDPSMAGRCVHGVRVVGTVDDLVQAARASLADQVLLAIPSADQGLVRRVADLAEDARLPVRLLPPVHELAGGRVGLRDVRDVDIRDLLGRAQVETDLDAVRDLLADKVVLVTGAGGSIGSEIARQVARFRPSELLLLDHDETHLFDVSATLPPGPVQVLADIRDRARINTIFGRWKPDVVFHAAAHKHVPLLETHPAEAIRTNVVGTDAVVQAAAAVGTTRFVFISTDKAVAPNNIMGASKRVAEQLVLSARPEGAAFCAVRFGNVLGSRGSVIPTFLEQIKHGGPVTVTDSRMTRYFMSIPEAVQLVLQSAALSTGGEIFMLDMGESVNIAALAERLVRLSGLRPGLDIEIRVTGIRPGEKLHEVLHESDEQPGPTSHPSILRIEPKFLSAPVLTRAVAALMVLTELRRVDEAQRLLLDLAHGRGEVHQGGLLGLRHERRIEDHRAPTVTGPQRLPRRRLADVVDRRGPDVVIVPDARRPAPLERKPALAPSWTSSTT